jgi:SAM-dependent methyltransferase
VKTQHQGTRRVRATAEALPFPDKAFDAAMAVMTIHHWADLDAGLAEMCRVAQHQVIFTWDKEHDEELWVVPEIRVMEHARFPCLDAVVDALGGAEIREFPIPHDFTDGYQPAFWRRPEAYLDRAIRAASSTYATLPDEIIEPAMRRPASRPCLRFLGTPAPTPPRARHGRLRLSTHRQRVTDASSQVAGLEDEL